jgi:hypothetical protein
MDKLQAYEFVGLICPGAFTIYSLSRIFPQLGIFIKGNNLSFGDFGLLLVLAFVAGHLVQALGNLVENTYWLFLGGKPTDWLRSGAHYLISPQQTAKMPVMIKELLKMDCPEDLRKLTRRDWRSLTRQIYAAVKKSSQAGRVDTFTAAYDLCRGIAASIVIVTVAGLSQGHVAETGISQYCISVLLITLAIYRMHVFGVHYARELFVQFLTIDPDTKDRAEITD